MTTKKNKNIQDSDARLRLFYLYRLLEQHTDEEHPKTTNQLRDLMEKEHGIPCTGLRCTMILNS